MTPGTSTPEPVTADKPRSESALLRIRTQIRATSLSRTEDCVRGVHEPEDREVGDISVMSDMSIGGRGPIHDMPRLAGDLLQRSKLRLEESRNLNREIREAVCSGMHGLYEMILRLADSRNIHIAEREIAKARYEKVISVMQTQHIKRIDEINKTNSEYLKISK